MPVVLCAGSVPPSVAERLSAFGEVVTIDSNEEQVVAQAAKRAVAIVARANVPVTEGVFDAAPELRVVGRSGTGTDNVDLDVATARGIPVVITPDAGTDAVAEGALTMLITLGKRIPLLHALTVEGRWHERDRVDILDIAGSAVGVVGFGRIGRQVTRLASALGASVRMFDPYLVGVADKPAAIRLDSLEELFATCEFVTLHLPLNDETRGLIDSDLLVHCTPGAVLVNASRGGLIRSLDDLADALDGGQLGGVGLDVYEPEPPDVSHRLFRDPRVLATPHILALSRSGRARIYDEMCGGIEAVFNGAKPKSIANPQIYDVDGPRHSEGGARLCR